MAKVMASHPGARIGDRRCTVELSNGSFCDANSIEEAPFPICERHFIQIVKFVMQGPTQKAQVKNKTDAERTRTAKRRRDAASVVYYLDMGNNLVKIGRSSNLLGRVDTLYRDISNVLAVEAGGAKTEAFRHKQFADEQVGRTETFHASARLTDHINELATATNALTPTEAVRQQRGLPPLVAPRSALANWF